MNFLIKVILFLFPTIIYSQGMKTILQQLTFLVLLLMPLFLLKNNIQAQARIVINSDFEQPLLANPNSFGFVHHTAVPGWVTTSTSGMIEIWRAPFNGVIAASGQQHIELNANEPADLYFDVCMFNGEVLNWSFFHRGRSGQDSARLLICPPGAELEVLRFGTSNSAWVEYSGNFTNTFGNRTIRFRFQPISTSGGNLTVGNFIDNVQVIGLVPIVEFEQTTYGSFEATGGNIPRLLVNGRIPAGGLVINIVIVGGTANLDIDFSHSLVFTIPAGDYDGTNSIDISSIFSIIDDANIEGDETVVFRLENPQAPLVINDANCSAAVNNQTTYTILDDDFLLAVELARFTVSSECKSNLLSWESANEFEHVYYIVEQSKDGISWQSIARVNAQENSSVPKSYQFDHHNPATETYYRLRMVDIYGESEFSDVIYAILSCNTNTKVTLYPNPFGDILNISSNYKIDKISIINEIGQIIFIENNPKSTISLDIPSGIYIIQLQIENNIINKKIVKMN
jgi:hypothetical protein